MARDGKNRALIEDIRIGKRLRQADPEAVARLAESIKGHGLMSPITIRFADNQLTLVAGLHRIEALKLLGEEFVSYDLFDGDERGAEMWEIAENLHRCDLTKVQRDEWVRRYAELCANEDTGRTECPGSLSDGRTAGPQHQKGIATKIAEETGLSARTVRRILAPPKPTPEPAPADEPETPELPFAPAPELPPIPSDNELIRAQLKALNAAWRDAWPQARRAFLDRINQ